MMAASVIGLLGGSGLIFGAHRLPARATLLEGLGGLLVCAALVLIGMGLV